MANVFSIPQHNSHKCAKKTGGGSTQQWKEHLLDTSFFCTQVVEDFFQCCCTTPVHESRFDFGLHVGPQGFWHTQGKTNSPFHLNAGPLKVGQKRQIKIYYAACKCATVQFQVTWVMAKDALCNLMDHPPSNSIWTQNGKQNIEIKSRCTMLDHTWSAWWTNGLGEFSGMVILAWYGVAWHPILGSYPHVPANLGIPQICPTSPNSYLHQPTGLHAGFLMTSVVQTTLLPVQSTQACMLLVVML